MKTRRSVRASAAAIDPLRARHLSLTDAPAALPDCGNGALFDEAESPLLWLARRKGSDGRPLIEPHHLQAGERLRADFTLAQMMPRTTSNWHSPIAERRRDGRAGANPTERVLDAKRRTRDALDNVGPEFAGLLLDVCCFLKRLEDVERERRWPARSAKVVLQLALEKLDRHFGYQSQACGKARAPIRTWQAEEEGHRAGEGIIDGA